MNKAGFRWMILTLLVADGTAYSEKIFVEDRPERSERGSEKSDEKSKRRDAWGQLF